MFLFFSFLVRIFSQLLCSSSMFAFNQKKNVKTGNLIGPFFLWLIPTKCAQHTSRNKTWGMWWTLECTAYSLPLLLHNWLVFAVRMISRRRWWSSTFIFCFQWDFFFKYWFYYHNKLIISALFYKLNVDGYTNTHNTSFSFIFPSGLFNSKPKKMNDCKQKKEESENSS